MFSLKIVDSDAFLDMPTSSRELYFQLGMRADDDGFVNPKKIIRMLGASEDDLRVLLSKRFLIAFENGVVVLKHWRINNLIRKDFYQETVYLDEKKRLYIKENKAYTDCLQNVNNLDTQVRLGKDSIPGESEDSQGIKNSKKKPMGGFNKNSEDAFEETVVDLDTGEVSNAKPNRKKKTTPEMVEVFNLFDTPARKLWSMYPKEREAAQVLYEAYGIEKLKVRMERIKKEAKRGDPMFPLIVTPSQLLDKMPNVERYFNI